MDGRVHCRLDNANPHLPTVHPSPFRPHPPPPTSTSYLHTLPSETKVAKVVMAATMTTIHGDDDNEYIELLPMLLPTKCQPRKGGPTKCQSAKVD